MKRSFEIVLLVIGLLLFVVVIINESLAFTPIANALSRRYDLFVIAAAYVLLFLAALMKIKREKR